VFSLPPQRDAPERSAFTASGHVSCLYTEISILGDFDAFKINTSTFPSAVVVPMRNSSTDYLPNVTFKKN